MERIYVRISFTVYRKVERRAAAMPVTITSIDNRTPYPVTVRNYPLDEAPLITVEGNTEKEAKLSVPRCKSAGEFGAGCRLVLRTPGIHANVVTPGATPASEYSIWQGKVPEGGEFIVFTFDVPGATQFTKNDVLQTAARKLTDDKGTAYPVKGNSEAQLRIEITRLGRWVYLLKR
jgi:hypothetical protein